MAIMNQLMMTAAGSGSNCPELEGELWAAGDGGRYMGFGNTNNISTLTQVGALTDWTNNGGTWKVRAHHIIKRNGTLWAWGFNNNGHLGTNDVSYAAKCSPIQIGSLTDWAQVANSYLFTSAIKTDGTLWVWGNNAQGQLGQGDTSATISPVQVGSLTDWASVDVDTYNIVALKTDGTMWAWGANEYGQLGLGDTTGRSSPVQIGSATNWIAIELGYQVMRALASA